MDANHPLVQWAWRPSQFGSEERRQFLAVVEHYEGLKAVSHEAAHQFLHTGILPWVPDMATPVSAWFERQCRELGHPVQWKAIGAR